MTCMKQEFCIHEKYCQRHIGQNFDSCILFSRNSKPMTNEEWLKSLDTEGLVDYLYEVHKGGDSVERQRWIERHREQVKMQFRGWLKEIHE